MVMIVGLIVLALVMTDFWAAMLTITMVSVGYVLIYKMLEDE